MSHPSLLLRRAVAMVRHHVQRQPLRTSIVLPLVLLTSGAREGKPSRVFRRAVYGRLIRNRGDFHAVSKAATAAVDGWSMTGRDG
jgi:hypothetical protein